MSASTIPAPPIPETLAPSPPKRRRRGGGLGNRPGFLTYGLLGAFVLGSAYPLWWSFVVGSGTNRTRAETLPLIPGENFIRNAMTVLDAVPFWLALGNSLIVASVITVSVVTFGTLAGYAFAKLRFRGRDGLMIFVIATMAIPTQLGIIPLFIVMRQLGWTGELGAIIVPMLVTAFGVFFMRQYLVDVIPDELIEAARVDGANQIRTFLHVAVPAARPAMAILGLFTFMLAWTDGYGFGAEGDWKTAVLVRAAAVMGAGLPGGTSLMKDYTYHLEPGSELILGAHMLEVSPSLSSQRARLEVHPLGIGGKDDPVRLVFDADAGPAVVVALSDQRDRFRLVANVVENVPLPQPMPNLPVGRAVWKPAPDFRTSATAWLMAGAAHHTVMSTQVGVEVFKDFAKFSGIELLVIDESTTVDGFERELRWNAAYHRLAQGL